MTNGATQHGDESASPGPVRAPISAFAATPEVLVRAALQPPESLLALGRLGQYEVLEVIGGGGMGYVLRARDLQGGEEVAIKLMRPELRSEPVAVRRFRKEALHMQRLEHANIIPVREVAGGAEGPYFVMDLMRGGSLAARLGQHQPLPTWEVVSIARQVALALNHAHHKGIIHRDLKPGNVLMNEAGEAFLSDFGLARTLFNDSLEDVRLSGMIGTAPYMSPGVARGEAEDTRCDIYAFGALLYEMLTGRPPYSGDTVQEVTAKILAGPPPCILRLNPQADPALAAIARSAMARKLRWRYATMEHVLGDLDRVAAAGPAVGLPRESGSAWRGSFPRWRPYRPILVGLVCLVALAGVYQLISSFSAKGEVVRLGGFDKPWLAALNQARLVNVDPAQGSLLVVSDQGRVWVFTSDGRTIQSFDVPEPFGVRARLHWAEQDPLHGTVELIIAESLENGWRVARCGLDGRVHRRFVSEVVDPAGRAVRDRLALEEVMTFDPAGPRRLLGRVHAVEEQDWNGVVCFDYAEGHCLWSYPTPGEIASMQLIDLDGDGLCEVVVATQGVGEKSRGPAETATPAQVVALSADGQLRWHWTVDDTDVAVRVLSSDLNGDGRAELHAWTVADRAAEVKSQGASSLVHLSPDGRPLRTRWFDHALRSVWVAEVDGDGRDEILATDRFGRVRLIEEELQVTREARVMDAAVAKRGRQVTLRAVEDLDRDGRMEVVLDTVEGEFRPPLDAADGVCAPELLILDARLEMRTRLCLQADASSTWPPPGCRIVQLSDTQRAAVAYFWPGRVTYYGFRE